MPANERTTDRMRINWDSGTAYDFFISQAILKDPKNFGIPSSWASGMRARLQCEDREALDASLAVINIPAKWIYSLSPPKDVEHCLVALSQIKAQNRLATLSCCPTQDNERSPVQQLLVSISERGKWNEADLEDLRACQAQKHKSGHHSLEPKDLALILDTWSQAEEFGEKLLRALRHYQDVFFREEEQRIASKLKQALKNAQERSKTLSSLAFLEEISQGIRYDDLPHIEELTLVPSYWISPFIQIHSTGKNHRLWTFGARPAEDSLVPGEPVPDALRVSLKALADPTRLRILRYLHQEPLTMAELTKRLRLRMPTVIHHLSALRLAGLVSIHVEGEIKGPRQRYGARVEGLDATLRSLKAFLENDHESQQSEVRKEE